MGFLRRLVTQSIGVALMGAAAALMAKLLGSDKSTIVVGMAGAVVGWCCCWLYTSWIDKIETRTNTSNDARLARAARQRVEIDSGIRITMPAPNKSTGQHEERP